LFYSCDHCFPDTLFSNDVSLIKIVMTLPTKVRRRPSSSGNAQDAAAARAALSAELDLLQSMTLLAANAAATAASAAAPQTKEAVGPDPSSIAAIRPALLRYSMQTLAKWQSDAAQRLHDLSSASGLGGRASSAAQRGANKRKAAAPVAMLKKRDKRSTLREAASQVLTTWLIESDAAPYPSASDRAALSTESGLNPLQVKNWFTNARKRHWKPVQDGKPPRSWLDFAIRQKLLAQGKLTLVEDGMQVES
jgi:hypothetical protein